MNRAKILAAATLLLTGFAAAPGCGGDSGNSGGSTGTGGSGASSTATTGTGATGATGGGGTGGDGGTGGSVPNPPPPPLGAQIDRFGRPAINTALNHTFDPDMAAKGTAKDGWNADKDAMGWAMKFGPEVAKNLAIIDSLDANCGNQLLAKPGMPVPADRYAGLAGVLASDRLWVKTSATTSTTYLAVEADATMILVNADGGGRKLDFDVIDISYSVLAIGMLGGVSDGIPADMDTKGTMFPFAAAPH